MKTITWSLLFFVSFGTPVFGADAPPSKTIIELSKPQPQGRGLGTAGYRPTETEAPFEAKVTETPINLWAGLEIPPPFGERPDPKKEAEEKKRREDDLAKAKNYSLAGQAGEYVGWFGIVRGSSWNEGSRKSELLIQHCYSDGLSDLHIQVVSIYGAGDFRAVLADRATNVPSLSLVRVFGKVVKGKDGTPEVSAEYVRVWDWGLFTFMDYGVDKTNPTWRARRQIEADNIYTPRPTPAYYESVLGKREPSKKN
jgi:hypothetical protein